MNNDQTPSQVLCAVYYDTYLYLSLILKVQELPALHQPHLTSSRSLNLAKLTLTTGLLLMLSPLPGIRFPLLSG